MSIEYPAGSAWRKWDLHAHTALDYEWTSRPDLESAAAKRAFAHEYVAAALECSLAVVAITDHNFCECPEQLLIPDIQSEAAGTTLVILPGFEVTVSDCGGTHLLVVFSEDTGLLVIDDVVKQLFPPGKERFRNGAVMPSEQSADALCRMLRNSNLRHLVSFAHADRENGVLHHRGGDLRARLWQCPYINIAQMSKHPSQNAGFLASIADGTNDAYRREMTFVLGSDCRQLRQDGSREGRFALGERFTWIKADPTFEGLRQIVSEPKTRVRLQEHEPDRKPDYQVIDSVRFIDDKARFQPQPIPINPDLTVIVGGKSTGKSVLLTTLAKAIDSEEAERRAQVSAVNVYDFNGMDLEVTWRDGTKDRLSAPSGQHRITFLPQMFIHKLVEGENSPRLSTSILSFLQQNSEFDALYSSLCRQVEVRNSDLHSALAELLSLLAEWREVNLRLREMGDRGAIKAEQTKVASRQEELRASSGFTEEETAQYQALSQQTSALKRELSYLQRHDAAFSELRTSVENVCQATQTQLTSLPLDLSSRHELRDADSEKAIQAIGRFNQSISQALSAFEQEVAAILAASGVTHSERAEELRSARSALQPFLGKIKNQEELSELQTRAESFLQMIDAIQSRTAEKTGIEARYNATLGQIRQLLEEHLSLKQQLSSLFSEPQYANIGDGIALVAELRFAHARFRTSFLEQFDMRASLDRFGVTFDEGELRWAETMHVDTIVTILKAILNASPEQLRLRAGRTAEDTIHALFGDYLEHSFTVQQNGENILLMSPGKQGLVLLELFLHLSSATYPILIDQPEDNLDNRTVYTHLAGYVRKKKVQRQIIIVTHNPNLVVGTDAEEVIVANQDGEGHGENEKYRFEYVSGSLECSFRNAAAPSVLQSQGIREHVCQVLEGGADAFRQRERKYNLAQQATGGDAEGHTPQS